MPDPDEWIPQALQELKNQDLLRIPATLEDNRVHARMDGQDYLNMSSNDYLGLANDPILIAASTNALKKYGTSARASRLVNATLDLHREAEKVIADFKNKESALLFGSGYLANIGIIPALVGRQDVIFADKLVHASLIDGIHLSRARLYRYKHNDMSDLEHLLTQHRGSGRALIITESVFSMDGDCAPLEDIVQLADAHQAMTYIDEAHATGVFGPAGAGRVAACGLSSHITICMGTLSKAMGSYGGYAACSSDTRDWLINRARSFIYSTALPPVIPAAAIAAVEVLRESPAMGRVLLKHADAFRTMLNEAGLNTGASCSQIIPVMMGEESAALEASEALHKSGILITAMRPPTVPKGSSRLRVSLSLDHDKADRLRAAEAIIKACAS